MIININKKIFSSFFLQISIKYRCRIFLGGIYLDKLKQTKYTSIENELCEKIAKELLPKLEALDLKLKSINFENSNDNLLKLKLTKV